MLWCNGGDLKLTFHFPHGEATITLQDVALQLGLKIDELPVAGAITSDVRVACQALLRDTSPNKYIKGKLIYLTWLRQNFQELPVHANDIVVAQYARTHHDADRRMFDARYIRSKSSLYVSPLAI